MKSINQEIYTNNVSRELLIGTQEMAYFSSNDDSYLAVIVKDLTDGDFQLMVHKKMSGKSEEYEFDMTKSKYNIPSYQEAYETLEELLD